MKRKVKVTNFKKFFRFLIILAIIIFILFKFSSLLGDSTKNVSNQSKETSTTVKKEPVTIHMSVIGDIMSHSANFKNAYDSDSKKYDFSNVFKNIEDYIKDADISIGNLETTFSGEKRGYSGYPTFNTPDELATNLKDLGIDILSTANNHWMK